MNKYTRPINTRRILFLFIIFILLQSTVFATVTILKATGGTLLSADIAANAPATSYTTLGNIKLTEGFATDFSVAANVTLILNAPADRTTI